VVPATSGSPPNKKQGERKSIMYNGQALAVRVIAGDIRSSLMDGIIVYDPCPRLSRVLRE
jgi:hypothetical protein